MAEEKDLIVSGQDTSLTEGWRSDSMPEHIKAQLANREVEGLEEATKHIVPNRLGIVQALSPIKEEGVAEGSIVAQPMGLQVTDGPGVAIAAIPVYFFTEYLVWNPRELKDQLPAIGGRARDPKDEIARVARDPALRNKIPCIDEHGNQRTGPKGDKLFLRYQEHLNFILCLPEVNARALFVVSFSRTQHRKGSALCAQLQMRGTSIYAGAFEMMVPEKLEKNSQGSWYGWSIEPAGWVEEPLFSHVKGLYQTLKESDADIAVEYDDDEGMDRGGLPEADVVEAGADAEY